MTALDTPRESLSLALDPVLDLRAARHLKGLLQQGLGRGMPLSIDASRVSRMSTACVQVLTAFVLETQRSGIALVLKGYSPVFDAAFGNLGLADILDTIKPREKT